MLRVIKAKYPGASGPGVGRSTEKLQMKKDYAKLPTESIVPLYSLLGLIEGKITVMKRLPCDGRLNLTIEPAKVSVDGAMTDYAQGNALGAHLREIQTLALIVARSFSGTFRFEFAFEKTFKFEPKDRPLELQKH